MKLTLAMKVDNDLRSARLALDEAERRWLKSIEFGGEEKFRAGHARKVARQRVDAAEAAPAAMRGEA